MDVLFEDDSQTVDLLLMQEGEPFVAYWILSRRITKFAEFVAPAMSRNIPFWIFFTGDAHKHLDGQLILPKYQRDQMRHSSEFDSCEFPNHGHLNYIDTNHSELLIYRGLTCKHVPQGYGYEKLRRCPLTEILIHHSGELILAEDLDFARERASKIKMAQKRPKDGI